MALQLFNTMSGGKEEFKPLNPPEVRMYTCGPTVYDFAHIGNFRTYVFQDLLKRYLSFKGFQVRHVMNITDVDDKTIAGANKKKVALQEFTKEFTQAFHDDLKTLEILPPNEELFATKTIESMLKMIAELIQKNHAYEKDGSVYFRIATFPNYGKLSKKDLEKNIVGARVDQDEYEKEEATDFVLWKKAKEGEPSWDSPWGKGRPGWHIECSAMSLQAFQNETLDIHTGGEDLVFPHHENEIAQSESATGKKFVNCWLHAKHLLVDGEKMSKSKGNFFTLRDLLKKNLDATAIRYALLSTHYRKQLNFTVEGVLAARQALNRVRDFHVNISACEVDNAKSSGAASDLAREAQKAVLNAMDDDLNVSEALGAIFEMIKKVNALHLKALGLQEKIELDVFFQNMDRIFGVFDFEEEIPAEIHELALKRQEARAKKDFKESDRIRDLLKTKGYAVEDAAGSAIKIKRIK